MATVPDLSVSLSGLSASMSRCMEMLQQMNDILDRMNGVSSASSSSCTASATTAFATTTVLPTTAPSAPAPSSTAAVVLFGVPLVSASVSSSSSTTSPKYSAPTTATTPAAPMPAAPSGRVPASASTSTQTATSTSAAPLAAVTTPSPTRTFLRLPTPLFLAAIKKIMKRAPRPRHARTAAAMVAGTTQDSDSAAATGRISAARATRPMLPRQDPQRKGRSDGHRPPLCRLRRRPRHARGVRTGCLRQARARRACLCRRPLHRLHRPHHRARLRPRRRGSGARRPRVRVGRGRLCRYNYGDGVLRRQAPLLRRAHTAVSMTLFPKLTTSTSATPVIYSDPEDTTAAGSSKPAALPSAALRVFHAMPSYLLFVSHGDMTSAVVLHALAADQEAAYCSVSLCTNKPASMDQFRKAYLKHVETSQSARHKVLHQAVSEGSYYGEYTNFIQLLLKARANPNLPDDLRWLPMELVALCECKEVELLLPFTLLIPNVRKWSVRGVHSHTDFDSTKLLDKMPFANKRTMVKSQDLASLVCEVLLYSCAQHTGCWLAANKLVVQSGSAFEIWQPLRCSQLSVWIFLMESMRQQVFDRGKYMEGDHTTMSMMDCTGQRQWPPLSQVGDNIYQLPKPPWLHDIGSMAYLFGQSWAYALQEKHFFAVLLCDLEKEYCFKCNIEMALPVKFGEGGNTIDLQGICDTVRQLPALLSSVSQTGAEVNPKKVEMTSKVHTESHPSGFGVDFANKWPSYESRSPDAHDFAISRIPNLRNTGYMGEVLLYLSMLGKLQERMLALDCPKTLFAKVLEEFFVEASTVRVLNQVKVLRCVHMGRVTQFQFALWKTGTICSRLCTILGIKNLSMGFPSQGHLTTSVALPQTSESPRFQQMEIAVQIFPTDVQKNLEKMQTVSASGYSHVIDSEVIAEKTHIPLEVYSTEVQHISQSKDVEQDLLPRQERSLAQSRLCHKDEDDIQNSGLRASRNLSGGECHVLGCEKGFQVGLQHGLPRPSWDRRRRDKSQRQIGEKASNKRILNSSSSSELSDSSLFPCCSCCYP